jgi:MIP family channel proteins
LYGQFSLSSQRNFVHSLPQKLAAEFIGTFTIIFIAVGSICADQYLSAANQPRIGPLGIALAYGSAYAAMVMTLRHVSVGHFNPAVTIGFWVVKRLGTLEAIAYSIVQLAAACAAAYLIRIIIPETAWRPVALGVPVLAQDFTRLPAMALEAVLTFFVVFIVFATAGDDVDAVPRHVAGLAVGLAIAMGALFGGPFTGAAMNPARAFGPALAAPHWQNQGVYWLGTLFGGIIAAFLHERLFPAVRHLS